MTNDMINAIIDDARLAKRGITQDIDFATLMGALSDAYDALDAFDPRAATICTLIFDLNN
jgi:hypothetical protein